MKEKLEGMLGVFGNIVWWALSALIAAAPLMKLLGKHVEAVITRLLGVLLAALAAQYVVDGLKQVLA